MSMLFLNLGFIRPDGRDSEQVLLANIWKSVGGDIYGKELIPLQRVKAIMCSIQNFHIDWIMDNQREDFVRVDQNNLGRIEDGNIYFMTEEI